MRPLVLAALVMFALTAPTPAASSVPFPPNCTLDPMLLCPAGDVTCHVVIRDASNIPIAGSQVVLDFGGCASSLVRFCPDPGPGIVADTAARTLTMVTNAQGQAFFSAHVGGTCIIVVRVFADGVLMSRVTTLVSPDQDANLIVDAADLAILNTKLGFNDPSGDLDFDGDVDGADVALLLAHMNHHCDGVVPIGDRSWGKLKTIYR